MLNFFLLSSLPFILSFNASAESKLIFISTDEAKFPQFIKLEIKKMRDELGPRMNFDSSIAWTDFNSDKKNDFCLSYASLSFGNAGGKIACYLAESDSAFRKVIDVSAMPEVVVLPGNKSQGFLDLSFGSAGLAPAKIWKWNGKEYN